MANKILIPLQSVISYFLEPPQTGEQQWVQLRDSGRGYLVVVAQVSGDFSVLNLCAKDQANENCEHRSGI